MAKDHKCETLKEKLIAGKDFEQVWEFFLDHFGSNETFVSSGKPVESKMLTALIGQVAGSILKTDVIKMEMILVRFDGHEFIHGSGFIEGQLSGVIYFEDICKGLLYIYMNETGLNQYARFTGMVIKPNSNPDNN